MTDAAPQIQAAPEPAPAPSLDEVAKQVWGDSAPEPAPEAEPIKTDAAPAEEPAKEEADPKIASRLTAAKRAEMKAAAERRANAAEKEAIAREKADIAAQKARLQKLEEDPHEFFGSDKDRVKRHLEKLAGAVEPEAVVEKKLTAVEQRMAALEAENAALKAREAQIQQESAWKEAARVFVDFVSEKADNFPHLVEEFSDEQATQYARVALNEVVGRKQDGTPVSRAEAFRAQHGRYPNDQEVAEFLEGVAKARIEKRQASAWRKQGNDAPKLSASQAVNGEQAKSPPVKGNSPRTLSSRDTSTRTASQKPWSQEAADEESLRIIEAGWRK